MGIVNRMGELGTFVLETGSLRAHHPEGEPELDPPGQRGELPPLVRKICPAQRTAGICQMLP